MNPFTIQAVGPDGETRWFVALADNELDAKGAVANKLGPEYHLQLVNGLDTLYTQFDGVAEIVSAYK